jgi:exopolyphosphatase/guanosine-5'-triphosphate,3'-diphosphate pyrophosphatase
VIAELKGQGEYKVIHSERASVRLGQDSFELGAFRDETIELASRTFAAFRETLNTRRIVGLRAVATSATREAANTKQLVDAVRSASGIELEVIDGLEEAQLMFGAITATRDLKGQSALLIDMGGGSVEITVAVNGGAVGAETLPLGPVRLLCGLRKRGLTESAVHQLLEPHAYAVEHLLRAELNNGKVDIAFGAGGSLEALGALRPQMLNKPKIYKLQIGDLETLIPMLLSLSVEERMDQLGLRNDRADVIAIAAIVLHALMDEADVQRIVLPGLGIKDGILKQLSKSIAAPTT